MAALHRADLLAASSAVGLALVVGVLTVAGPAAPLGVLLAGSVIALCRHRKYAPMLFGFVGVAAAIVLLPANALRLTGSATYADVLLVAALGAVALAMLSHWYAPTPPPLLVAGATLLALSVALSVLFEPATRPNVYIFSERGLPGAPSADEEGWVIAVRLGFALLVVPYLIAVTITTWTRVRIAVGAWMVGAGASALVAVLAAFTGFDYQETLTGVQYSFIDFGPEADRLTGLAVHPSALGLASAMAAPVAMVKLGDKNGWWWAALLALFGSAIVLSGARAALIAVTIGAAYVAWKMPVARRRLAVVALAAMTVGYVQSVDVSKFGIVQRITGQAISSSQSDSQRGAAFEQGFTYGLERPFGWGFDVIRGAHNLELGMITAGGLPALIALGLLVVGIFSMGRDLARRRDIPEDMHALATALLGSLAVWFIAVQLQSNVFDRWLFIPGGLLLGMWFVAARS